VAFGTITAFFELRSSATEGEKGEKWEQKRNFLAD